MQHAYASFNKAVKAAWATIAPTVPIVFEHPEPPDVLPTECLRVYWLRNGGSTKQANEMDALVQLDIFVHKSNRALAQGRAAALNQALGFTEAPGYGRLGRFDWTTSPETLLSEMEARPFEAGWVQVPDPKPKVVHYARTVMLTYRV